MSSLTHPVLRLYSPLISGGPALIDADQLSGQPRATAALFAHAAALLSSAASLAAYAPHGPAVVPRVRS